VIEETIHSLRKIKENESEINCQIEASVQFSKRYMEQNWKKNLIATTGQGRCHKDLKKIQIQPCYFPSTHFTARQL
jgi:hypothetical protein